MPETASKIVKSLSIGERRVVGALPREGQFVSLASVTQEAGFKDLADAYSAASWLQKKGLVEIEERVTPKVSLGPDAAQFISLGFPERRLHANVAPHPSGRTVSELRELLGPSTVDIALAWWQRKGIGRIEREPRGATVRANGAYPSCHDEEFFQEVFSKLKATDRPVDEEFLRSRDPKAYDMLRARPGLLEVRPVKERLLRLTPLGVDVARSKPDGAELVGEISPDFIKGGAWRGKEFQAYDVRTEAPRPAVAKPHPLVQIIDEVRSIFIELGFQEIEDEYVQSAFWNMDALFIPQDHPARDMQDTLYLDQPKTLDVPGDLVARISEVHRRGTGTKSRGWGHALDPAESRRALLRTHTTVGTIRYLAKNPKPPVRVFTIGRVFRNETMDATHLPEFHQIEGIATEEGADFPMLLGILQEFYRRLGFPQLRWRPAYFPYTEPSMEVEVWTGTKWMELGGCGIFRPEVTLPFGVKTPVLAWGLGLERLAMMRLGLKDIRDLYLSDLEWLRSQPLL